MATQAQFIGTPKNAWTVLTTANTATDGTGTVNTIFTAGASGGYVKRIIAMPKGSNVQSVLRVFENNGNSSTTSTNNSLINELTLPQTTASANSAQTPLEINLEHSLPAGYKINVTIGTTVSDGWCITAEGGDF